MHLCMFFLVYVPPFVYVPPLVYVSPFGTDDTRVNPTEDACNPLTHVYSGAPWLNVYTQGPPGHICRFRGPLGRYVYKGAPSVHTADFI